ncbi:MAG: 50S ribosome-binding GTPase [Candidatus Bathyarchaeota archaeon]|nr:MAG: 50S ribosome-binding GTPase [Candidatus Bathyarchaeota archaeon]
MPANLPGEARRKWNEVLMARNPKEKLRLLQEFLSLVPKHKGTRKLRAQVKTKMATLRRELEAEKHKKAGARGPKSFIEKEGAAQFVILGLTKVGRSSLLKSVTNAKVEVSDYPYSTQEPIPGMLPFEDIQFQIVEAPAVIEGAAEGKGWGAPTLALARNADGLILMIDLQRNPSEQISLILRELENARILLKKPKSRVDIERKHMGIGLRILVIGRLIDCNLKDVKTLLESYGVTNAIVKIYGNATIDDVEDSIFESVVFRPTIIVANKIDIEGAAENFNDLRKILEDRFNIIKVSCRTKVGMETLGTELFKMLEIIRIYTKEPNSKEPSIEPFILKKDSTVAELAKQIHSDFYKHFAYAKVWANRFRFSPRKVGLSFNLRDKDVVEMHMR